MNGIEIFSKVKVINYTGTGNFQPNKQYNPAEGDILTVTSVGHGLTFPIVTDDGSRWTYDEVELVDDTVVDADFEYVLRLNDHDYKTFSNRDEAVNLSAFLRDALIHLGRTIPVKLIQRPVKPAEVEVDF